LAEIVEASAEAVRLRYIQRPMPAVGLNQEWYGDGGDDWSGEGRDGDGDVNEQPAEVVIPREELAAPGGKWRVYPLSQWER
jgi:hypothetical protein